MIKKKAKGCISVQVQQARRVIQGQSHTSRSTWRIAKADVTGVYNTGTRNKKKLQTDLVRGAYRLTVFVLSCNTAEVWER